MFSSAFATFTSLTFFISRFILRETENGFELQTAAQGSSIYCGREFSNYVVGNGVSACDVASSPDDFVVALNARQFDGGANCFRNVTLSYGLKITSAQVVNECFDCRHDGFGLQLSPALFEYFSDLSQRFLCGDWWFSDEVNGKDLSMQCDISPPSLPCRRALIEYAGQPKFEAAKACTAPS